MNDRLDDRERVRQERLRTALRDNLKRRKSQAKGRAAGAIVTPEDERNTSDSMQGTIDSDDSKAIHKAWR